MSLYSPSEFLQKIKEDAEISDMPLPVTDKQLYDRIINSSLKEFSQIHPYIKTIIIGENEIENKSTIGMSYDSNGYKIRYVIPEHQYYPLTLLGIAGVNVAKMTSYSDAYIPQYGFDMPIEDIILNLSQIQTASTIGSFTGKTPTGKFIKNNKVDIYNAWMYGYYEVDLKLSHDPSLSTISDTAFTSLIELATYDIEWFLYGKLKRKNNIETGAGTYDLQISDWADSKNKFKELLKEWKEDHNLDYDSINFW